MPIGEDDFDYGHMHTSFNGSNNSHQFQAMSKAEQRRSNKPIMEKKRRARINHCLNELKTLILDAMKKDPARHSKLEKADILEMTVKHLQTIQRQQLSTAMTTDPSVIHKFKNGFNECATEVSRYIHHMEGIESSVKQRLVSHLASCVNGLQQISPQFSSTSGYNQYVNNPMINPQQNTMQISPEDVNNNHQNSSNRLQNMMNSLQLIPSRLPTGELALLLPNSQQIPGNVLPFFQQSSPSSTIGSQNTYQQIDTSTNNINDRAQQHISAFTAVSRHQTINQKNYIVKSPLPSPTSSITSNTSSIHYEDISTAKSTNNETINSNTLGSSTDLSTVSSLENNIKNNKNNFISNKVNSPPVLAVKPLSLLKENNNNNLLLKTTTIIQDYSNNNNNIIKDNKCLNNNNQNLILPETSFQIPLTVITNDNINNRLTNNKITSSNSSNIVLDDLRYQHPALDYSMKKDNLNLNNDHDNNFYLNNHNISMNSLKRKRNNENNNNNSFNLPVSFSPKVLKLSNNDSCESVSSSSPSTSFETVRQSDSTVSNEQSNNSNTNNNDMWRPW